MFSVPIYLIPVIIVVCLYKIASQALPRYFLTPTHNWKDKIQKVIDYPKPIYLKVGNKRSAFRRRLITASLQPSFYTNFLNNKLKIQPDDAKDGSFLERMKIRDPTDARRKLIYGFFHPYANNGGGGEKVLWQAVSATLLESDRNIVAIYTTNTDAEPLQILAKAQDKFQIANLDSRRIVFVYLRRAARFIDSAYWKHFTLVGQLFGSFLLGLEAMNELSPDVWVDTMGLPGSYFPVRVILKIPIVSYVHYPIIQPDMFNRLKFKTARDLTTFRLSASDIKHLGKFVYWSALYLGYALLGSCVDLTFANGTWTHNHMKNIWFFNKAKPVEILYPPCATEHLAPSGTTPRENKLLYIAQFRPEKRHSLVLDEYNTFLARFRESKLPLSSLPKLVFLGSCRTKDDSSTLESLQAQVEELGLAEYVEFVVDCSFDEVKNRLHSSKIGINAMWNEHFGIGVVEYMAAGVVPLVHASAGPLLDIMAVDGPSKSWKNDVGFFFKSEQDPDFEELEGKQLKFTMQGEKCLYPTFSDALTTLFIDEPELAGDENLAKQRQAGAALVRERFSTQKFTQIWMDAMEKISSLEVYYRENKRDKVDSVY